MCICGALDCSSCGPLQGSTHCEEHDRLACADCADAREEDEE